MSYLSKLITLLFNCFSKCSYINGSPQNTNVPGVVDLAKQHGVFIGGDDFKSGQTKMKSVLVDFLVSAGLKVCSFAFSLTFSLLFLFIYIFYFSLLLFSICDLLACIAWLYN